MRFTRWRWIISTVLLVACSGGGTDPTPGMLDLSASQSTLVPAETLQLAWQVKDGQGNVSNEIPTFTSSATSVASIAPNGVVTAVSAGPVTVTARVGSLRDQVALSVVDGGVVSAAGGTLTADGGKFELVVPAGAVGSATAIRLATAPNPLLDPTAVAGPVYSVGPETASFGMPVTIRIRFNPNAGPVGLPAAEIRLRRFDGAAWAAAAAATTDAGTNTASATTMSGGLFSAGWVSPAAPCVTAESRQFDFWVGAWTVSARGQTVGQSDITAAAGGCAVFEHYRDGGGTVGRSISFYESSTGRWYQTYVDNLGSRLLLAGTLVGGAMELFNPPAKGNVHQRWRWTAEGLNVRQVATETNNGGASYGTPSWDGLYVKR